MVPVMNSLGIETRWEVLEAEEEFFNITKKIHNGLQGNINLKLTEEEWNIYLKWNQYNAELLDLDADILLIHDPQPMALPLFVKQKRATWVWRCHIDLSSPNHLFWNKVASLLKHYNAVIVHSEEYVQPEFSSKAFVSPPSIDPLSEKNRELTRDEIEKVFSRFDVNIDRPTITKVARFDPWKDIFTSIDVYRELKGKIPNIQLLLISSMAKDDPEGMIFYNKVKDYIREGEAIYILTDEIGVKDLEVNAFQRGTTVGIHTAIREGFGLAVTEMLWKHVPVVARPVGGVKKQVINNVTGFTAFDKSEIAQKVELLLIDKNLRRKFGEAGHEHVRRNFVITKHVERYLSLFAYLLLGATSYDTCNNVSSEGDQRMAP